MKSQALLKINPLLSDRIRLAIMAALVSSPEPLDFNTLLTSLEVSKGNLSTHLRRLEEGGLIVVHKTFRDRKPHTSYRETSKGSSAIKDYFNALEFALTEGGK